VGDFQLFSNPMPYPDFLCIGAAKCGTTWLHWNLIKHRQVSLPYIKEIHYFNGQAHGIPNDFIGRLRDPRVGYWRRALIRQLKKPINYKSIKRMKWLLNYALRTRNDKWYKSLFHSEADQVSGEHTPGYYFLDLEHVERIHKLMPECRIIFFIRNPVEQIWSMVKFMNFKVYKKNYDDMSHDDLKNICDTAFRFINSDYLLHLSKWEKVFPKDNIFIGFYDEICECPEDLLLRIFGFLGIEKLKNQIFPVAHRNVNKGPEYDLPDDIRVMLVLRSFDNLKRLHERFGGYATKWLEEETEFLEEHDALPDTKLPSSLRSTKYCCTA